MYTFTFSFSSRSNLVMQSKNGLNNNLNFVVGPRQTTTPFEMLWESFGVSFVPLMSVPYVDPTSISCSSGFAASLLRCNSAWQREMLLSLGNEISLSTPRPNWTKHQANWFDELICVCLITILYIYICMNNITHVPCILNHVEYTVCNYSYLAMQKSLPPKPCM